MHFRKIILGTLLAFLLSNVTAAFAEGGERFVPSARSTREVAERYFDGWLVEWAVRTAACESTHKPWAQNSGVTRDWRGRMWYYDYRGLLQVDEVLWAAKARELFGPDASLFDPDVNMGTAAWLVGVYGTSPWPVCGQ